MQKVKICDKDNKECCDTDCNLCIKNEDVLENIVTIRTALKMLRGFGSSKEVKARSEKALRWVDDNFKRS